ncbi:MAG: NAD(P)H-hydrate dehydratase [Natronomonas sp.]
MITSNEMAVVDANAAALGVPRKQLMESSGNAIARVVRDVAAPDAEIAIVCGRGNNGGDGFVAARFLEGVRTYLLGRPESINTTIAAENFEALRQAGESIEVVRDTADFAFGDPDVVVDAMLGTGVTGGLREPEATVAERIDETDATVVAVDVPSGIDADTGEATGIAVDADHVVTFHDTKPGLTSLDAEVTVADIGIPTAAERFVERGDLLRLETPGDAHKGDFGRVLVVGGGPYTGAPALTGRAALRAGGDLAYVACPRSIADSVAGYDENLIVRPFAGERLRSTNVEAVLSAAKATDTAVVGPGLGDEGATLRAVVEFLEAYDGTVVVDADALSVVAEADTEATLVCTPHAGEFPALVPPGVDVSIDGTRPEDRIDTVETVAEALDATILLKGPTDVISNGDRTRLNHTGNPGMTVGGTGDVLAGTVAALAARLDPIHAAGVGAYATGRAGDSIVAETGSRGLLATDLLEALPEALTFD